MTSTTKAAVMKAGFSDFVELCKPRVVLLMLITSLVGMCLASPHFVGWQVIIFGNLGIGLCSAAAAAINHLADYRIDRLMERTHNRPIVKGAVSISQTVIFATVLCASGVFILVYFVNLLTAGLTFLSLVVYAGVYTFYLKHATPQNIVIGGIAGAAPPLLGWVAVTAQISALPLLLLLIIFVWTPPHFWALAIARRDEYALADVPMLPNTHGVAYTKRCSLFYTILMLAITLLPFASGACGYLYLLGVMLLNSWFLFGVIKLCYDNNNKNAMRVFYNSIVYLFLLFIVLLLDHFL